MKTFIIAENQRGLLVKDGRLVQVLGPGRHFYWLWNSRRMSCDIVAATGVCASPLVDGVEKRHPELAEANFEIVAPVQGEVAIVRTDGRATQIVRGGDVVRVWKVLDAISVDVIDVEAEPKLSKRLLNELRPASVVRSEASTTIKLVEVSEAETAIVLFDGELYETVGPGRYGYWQVGRVVNAKALDTRPVPLEVTAQEILTKDRVSIRVTLTSFVKVTDAVVAAMATPDYQAHVYKLVQFAVREAVAGRTLDELLNDRVKVDAEIVGEVRRQVEGTGVEVTGLAIKDVILPGEMRELINRVVEAEKVAQANLIRRREETAATRSLLNTAKLMADNPVLMRLKELEALERVTDKIGHIEVKTGSGEGLEVLTQQLVKIADRD
ncbi:MAG: SPFH domain-containing protein [Erythrobacter sp.]|uniref:slipin family protein n=1 Tax=Erythrobacter sp. TaxID=1042 RepID=UPI00261B3BCC|nr:SPFH domain-containing protein [Erythrobacter sp.]MDJ0977427.1 SPFH domain-containing protein [Erythrobacter sp.]